jgi:hypothetical protein
MLSINAQLGTRFLMHVTVGTWVESSRLLALLNKPYMPLKMFCFFIL